MSYFFSFPPVPPVVVPPGIPSVTPGGTGSKYLEFLAVLLYQIERVDFALLETWTLTTLANAINSQLDRLGALVGEKRQGLVDDDYRRTIGARIAINRSTGRREDIIRIALSLVNTPGTIIAVSGTSGVALVDIRATNVDLSLATLVYKYLNEAIEATVRLGVVYRLHTGDEFLFSLGDTSPASSTNGFSDDGGTFGGYLDGIVG